MLDLGVMSLSSTLGREITLEKGKKKKTFHLSFELLQLPPTDLLTKKPFYHL